MSKAKTKAPPAGRNGKPPMAAKIDSTKHKKNRPPSVRKAPTQAGTKGPGARCN